MTLPWNEGEWLHGALEESGREVLDSASRIQPNPSYEPVVIVYESKGRRYQLTLEDVTE